MTTASRRRGSSVTRGEFMIGENTGSAVAIRPCDEAHAGRAGGRGPLMPPATAAATQASASGAARSLRAVGSGA
jgi:hypothetical protein